VVHFVPYLIGLGMTPRRAAGVFSIAMVVSTLGKPAMGIVADRVGSRPALGAAVFSLCAAFLLLTQAGHPILIVPLVLFYGIGVGAPVALVPMLAAESFGLRSFGTLTGLIGIFGMLGTATGPMFAGRIFDVSGGYVPAFILMSGVLFAAAMLPFGCLPFTATSSAGRALAHQAPS